MAGTEEEWDNLGFDFNKVIEKNKEEVHNKHYALLTPEPIDLLESWMTIEQFRGFLKGNVIKYIARYEYKNGKEDLVKAEDYLVRLKNTY